MLEERKKGRKEERKKGRKGLLKEIEAFPRVIRRIVSYFY